MEITLNLKADPAITDAINNLAEAIRGHQSTTVAVAVPERLLETPIPKTMQETVTTTVGKKRGRPAKEPEPAPEPAPNTPKIEVVSGLPTDLPNYDKLRTQCRHLITEGMNRDLLASNKVNREKAKEIINTVCPTANGKISEVPNELLASVLPLLEDALR